MPPTTTADERRDPAARGANRRSLPVAGIVRSEFTKLRSVKSTIWTLLCTAGIMVGFGALFSAAYVQRLDRLGARERLNFDPTFRSLQALFLAQLAIGVLGVLFMTNEYATGMIRNTLAAVPQRSAVLAAKLAVFSGVAFAVALIGSFLAFSAGQAILSQKHVQAHLGDPGVLRSVIGCAFYLTGIGILGLALGAILRRTAGAIAALVGLVLVLPLLAQALPSPWNTDVEKVLPGGAARAFIGVRPDVDVLRPGAGFAVFVVYPAATVGLAFFMLTRRDA